MVADKLKAPFPAFGGKSAIAGVVWQHLGDVRNYIEPFCFSAAMLLLQPHAPKIETINDLDCFIANFWRATQHDPEGVVEHADGPVNETDLHARHRWLVFSDDAAAFRERMRTDPDYYDVRIAGWWCWGLCCWIGSGWCDTEKYDRQQNTRPSLCSSDGQGQGVHKRPKLAAHGVGAGVHRKRPNLGDGNGGAGGKGVSQQIPELGQTGPGKGVHRDTGGRPQLADAYSRGRGVHGNDAALVCQERREWLLDWFGRLRDRLRCVRVCCGDWLRVCGSRSVTTRIGQTGVFLDPPYSDATDRTPDLYSHDDLSVAHRVRDYCIERGGDPAMRIALCGKPGEHEDLEKHGWSIVDWQTQGGYANRGDRAESARAERIWFSPHCVRESTLFDRQDTLPSSVL